MTKYNKTPEAISRLSPEQYRVTQQSDTERPFQNAYWNHHEPGLYVDVVSGEPLFTSLEKYDSHCGWPSFTKPIAPENVLESRDTTHGMIRTEVRSTLTATVISAMFSATAPRRRAACATASIPPSLRFIPLEDLEREGYGDYIASCLRKLPSRKERI